VLLTHVFLPTSGFRTDHVILQLGSHDPKAWCWHSCLPLTSAASISNFISMSLQFTWNLMTWCCIWLFPSSYWYIYIYTTLKHYLLPLVYIYVMSKWKKFLRYNCCSFHMDTRLMVMTVICLQTKHRVSCTLWIAPCSFWPWTSWSFESDLTVTHVSARSNSFRIIYMCFVVPPQKFFEEAYRGISSNTY
jgi:hypothetical protein